MLGYFQKQATMLKCFGWWSVCELPSFASACNIIIQTQLGDRLAHVKAGVMVRKMNIFSSAQSRSLKGACNNRHAFFRFPRAVKSKGCCVWMKMKVAKKKVASKLCMHTQWEQQMLEFRVHVQASWIHRIVLEETVMKYKLNCCALAVWTNKIRMKNNLNQIYLGG